MPRILQNILLNAPFSQRKPPKFDHILYAGFAKSSSWGISLGSFDYSTRAGIKEAKSAAQPQKRVRNGTRVIQTLDQSRLKPSDFQDISGLRTALLSTTSNNKGLGQRWKFTFFVDGGTTLPFPEGTHGFFFYRPANLLSPTRNTPPSDGPVGQVYFRITKDNDPASFASGMELMDHNRDVPWYIVPRAKTTPLWRLLLKDGLVTASTKNTTSTRSSISHISTFSDPFIIDLSHYLIHVSVRSLRDGNVLRPIFRNPLGGQFGLTSLHHQFYTGRLLCRFERSPYPNHAGTDTFVIRVLEVLSPVKCIPLPSVGEGKNPFTLPRAPQVGDLMPAKKAGETLSFPPVRKRKSSSKKKSESSRALDALLENEALMLAASTD